MNCFRGNHPHRNGHVYSSTALPTDGEKKRCFDWFPIQSSLMFFKLFLRPSLSHTRNQWKQILLSENKPLTV